MGAPLLQTCSIHYHFQQPPFSPEIFLLHQVCVCFSVQSGLWVSHLNGFRILFGISVFLGTQKEAPERVPKFLECPLAQRKSVSRSHRNLAPGICRIVVPAALVGTLFGVWRLRNIWWPFFFPPPPFLECAKANVTSGAGGGGGRFLGGTKSTVGFLEYIFESMRGEKDTPHAAEAQNGPGRSFRRWAHWFGSHPIEKL